MPERMPRMLRTPPGEIYMRTEAPRGEYGIYLVSKGGNRPYRLKIRSSCFANLQALRDMTHRLVHRGRRGHPGLARHRALRGRPLNNDLFGWEINVWVDAFIRVNLIILFMTVVVMGLIYLERKVLARFQMRYGPMKTGPIGHPAVRRRRSQARCEGRRTATQRRPVGIRTRPLLRLRPDLSHVRRRPVRGRTGKSASSTSACSTCSRCRP